jgi:hypothetical protein
MRNATQRKQKKMKNEDDDNEEEGKEKNEHVRGRKGADGFPSFFASLCLLHLSKQMNE